MSPSLMFILKCFIKTGISPSEKDSTHRRSPAKVMETEQWRRSHDGTLPPAKSQRRCGDEGGALSVCSGAGEIPPKIPNVTHGEEWQPAQGRLKQQWINLLPHTVNHTHLSWGEEEACRGQIPAASAFLVSPPAGREPGRRRLK